MYNFMHTLILQTLNCSYFLNAVNNVVIGFVGAPYSANESNGVLFVEVGVLSGTLQVEVVVNISTRDITTLGIIYSIDSIQLKN